jgi:hypothetical protein
LVNERVNQLNPAVQEGVKSVATGLGAAGAWTGVKVLAGTAVPTVMSWTGVVVKGVGTLHGGVTATSQMIAAGTLGPSAVTVGALGVTGYLAYRGIRSFSQNNRPNDDKEKVKSKL